LAVRGPLVVCVFAAGACGLGELDGLTGGHGAGGHGGGTDSDVIAMDGPGDEPVDDSGAGGGGDDSSSAGGSAGEADASDAEETGEPDGSLDATDAADSGSIVADAGKILALTVYDDSFDVDGGASSKSHWAIRTDFRIGQGVVMWDDWSGSYFQSIDGGAQHLLGKDWVKTYSKSKVYYPATDAGPLAEAKITLNATADVYLIVDDRATSHTNPAGGAGWSDTGYDMLLIEGSRMFKFSVWVKKNQAGDVDLPIQNYNGAYNYFVIVE
jgi:hypothetical protein